MFDAVETSMVGKGGTGGEPPVGARLGFSAGYNDTDGDEDPDNEFFDRLRWVNSVDPWSTPGDDGAKSKAWGELEMGPVLSAETP